MGREIRRAPPGWEHPRYTDANTRYDQKHFIGRHHPMFDKLYTEVCREWLDGLAKWQTGERPDYFDAAKYPADIQYWEWNDGPPSRAYYRDRDWTPEEATRLAVYETVSEGTPVTPFFDTPEELVEYLVANGDTWDQKRGDGGWDRAAAERFVRRGWAPSMMVHSGPAGNIVTTARDAAMYPDAAE